MGINYNNIYVHTDQRQLKVPKKKKSNILQNKHITLYYKIYLSKTPSLSKTFSISANKVSVVAFDPLTLTQTISDFCRKSL